MSVIIAIIANAAIIAIIAITASAADPEDPADPADTCVGTGQSSLTAALDIARRSVSLERALLP